MKILNYTPHAITLLNADGLVATIQSSGNIRVTSSKKEYQYIPFAGTYIPVFQQEMGEIEFPSDFEYEEGTIYVVSRIVKEALKDNMEYYQYQNYFMVPDDLVRDEKGVIIGCKGFSL